MPKKSNPMVHHIPITQARINLGQVVRRVHNNKECFVLEKDGIPVAGIINIADMEDWLELQNPNMKKQIAEGHTEYRRGKTKPLGDFLTKLRAETKAK